MAAMTDASVPAPGDTLDEALQKMEERPPEDSPPVAEALADVLAARLDGESPPEEAVRILEEYLADGG